MHEVEVASVCVDSDGGLLIAPMLDGRGYEFIYRAAMGVYWQPSARALRAPAPDVWTYGDWFVHVCEAVLREYGDTLVLTSRTHWDDVGAAVREDIEAASRRPT